ncbi:MAG TPA: hypothetical protein VHF06_05730, partial [Pseudonocardiaceae bacterium]|nr:hypothetical protein [Pseudonocardiaceae bacterium]
MSMIRNARQRAGAAVAGERATGRQAWRLLWAASRTLSVLVIGWVVLGAVMPALVVGALGAIVGQLPGAIRDGMGS